MVHSVCKREKKNPNIYIHRWEVTMQPLENYIIEYLMIWKNVCKIMNEKLANHKAICSIKQWASGLCKLKLLFLSACIRFLLLCNKQLQL